MVVRRVHGCGSSCPLRLEWLDEFEVLVEVCLRRVYCPGEGLT